MGKANPPSVGQTSKSFPLSNKVWMYSCLVPVFGLVPSLMVLIGDRSSQEVRNTSKVAIVLALVWLASAAMLGSDRSGDLQVTAELVKGTLTSAYFVACTYLMFQLYRGQKIGLPWSKPPKKS